MAKAKANVETLTRLSSMLKKNYEDISFVKSSMDRELEEIRMRWDDPVGIAFIEQYYEKLKPVEGKLVPDLMAYCRHLDNEAIPKLKEYLGQ